MPTVIEWMQDAIEHRHGQHAVFGRRMTISVGLRRHYLWLQIMAGWLLSGIFIAVITGLIRND
jgi:hypothetical protein